MTDVLLAAERAARESEQRFGAIFAQVIVGIAQVDLTGRFMLVNQRYCDMLGYTEQELLDLRMQDVTHPEDLPRNLDLFRRAVEQNLPFVIEKRYRRKDGSTIWVNNSVSALRDADGRAHAVCAVSVDVTARKRAEAELARSRHEIQDFVENAAIGLHWIGPDGVIQWANRAELELLGYARDEYVGHHVSEFHVDQEVIYDILSRLKAGEVIQGCEARMRCKDGSIKHVLIDSNVFWQDGKFIHTRCFTRDVSKRKQAEERMALYRQIVANSNDGIGIIDPSGYYLEQNAAHARLTGYSDEEIRGQTPALHLGEEVFRQIASALASTGEWRGEAISHTRSGKDVPVEVSAFAVKDSHGKPICFVGVKRDVSQRKATEEAVRRSEQRYRSLVDATAQVVWTTNAAGEVVEDLPSLRAFTGQTFEQIKGLGWSATLHPDDRERVMRVWSESLRSGLPHETEFRIRAADGQWRNVVSRAVPVTHDDGTVREWVGTCSDVTDRKRWEEALWRSEHRFRKLVEQSPLSTQIYSPDGRPLQSNAAWERLFGVTMADVADYNVLEDPELAKHGVLDLVRRGFAGEVVNVPPIPYVPAMGSLQGQIRWTGATIYPVKNAAGEVEEVVLVHEDITERKRAEEAMRKSEQQLRVALETAKLGAWRLDLTTGQMECTPQCKANFGRAPDDRFDYDDLLAAIHPDDREAMQQKVRQALEQGSVYEAEYRVVWPEGATRWIVASGRGIGVTDGGAPVEMIGVTLDITERKRFEEELKRAKEAAEAANRAKDQFLAVLSHELRTPLTPVLAIVCALEQQADLPRSVRADVEVVRRNVELETRLIDDLLDLTRITKGKLQLNFEPVDLRDCVNRVVEICREEIDARQILLLVDIPARECFARGDNARLQQVLWNLVKNAVKFTPPGGKITITGSCVDNLVTVSVSDTGLGIEPDVLPRLFNAFEQGKPGTTRQFGGLGLGLAISKYLAEAHGGTLTASSAGRNQGSTFTLKLPVARAPARDPEKQPAPAPTQASPSRRILLVEDHADTAQIMKRLLRGFNYDVEWAGNVADALRVAQRQPFDLVVSDLGLPDGSGIELMRQLRDRYGLRGIALSGYGMEDDVRKSFEAGFVEHLTKPVNLQALKATIETVMSK